MANLPIPDEQTWISYEVTTASTGPFAFNFSVFAKADLRVSVGGIEIEQADFTFAGSLIDTGYDGGTIELVDAAENTTVLIWRDIQPVRTADFSPATVIPVKDIDASFDRLTAVAQDLRRDVDRAFKVEIGNDDPGQVTYEDAVLEAAEQVSSSAQALVTAAGNAQVTRVEGEGDDQVARVEAEGDDQVDRLDAARLAALVDLAQAAQNGLFAAAGDGVSNGVVGTAALIGGAGGANGQYDLAFAGGGGTGAAGRFTVAGGTVISIVVTAPGVNYAAAPAISFAACPGLAGASATAVIGPRTASGEFFLVAGAGDVYAHLYKNVAGVATDQGVAIASQAALAAFTDTFDPDAAGPAISSFVTPDFSSILYIDEKGALRTGKLLNDRAQGTFFIETAAPVTGGSGQKTNSLKIFTHAGHDQNDKVLVTEFTHVDQTAYSGARKEKAWQFAALREQTRGKNISPWGPMTPVRNLIFGGVQGIILGETQAGGVSVDDGGVASPDGFIAPSHGSVWEVEPAVLLLDGVRTDIEKHDRWTSRAAPSFRTKLRYYRNRAGNLLTGTGPETFARAPVALVDSEVVLASPTTAEMVFRVVFQQTFTGIIYAPAMTVATGTYTHLTRYADEVRRTAIVDFVGNGGANTEQVTRQGVTRVTYDGAHGGLDLEVVGFSRWNAGGWPHPPARVAFGRIEHTLKVAAEPKSYFTFYGDVAGPNYAFQNGDVLEFRFRATALLKRDY